MTVKADWVDKDTPGKSAADWTFDAAAANAAAAQCNGHTTSIATKVGKDSIVFNVADYVAAGGGTPLATNAAPAIAACFTAMKQSGKASGRMLIPDQSVIATAVDLDGGYSDTQNAGNWGNATNPRFVLEARGLQVSSGVGAGLTLHGFYGLNIDVSFRGGGSSSDVALELYNLHQPDISVEAMNFAGTVLKADMYVGAAYVDARRIRTGRVRKLLATNCGQTLYWRGVEAFGTFDLIWDNGCTNGSYMGFCADHAIKHYENYSPATQTVGLTLEGCNSFNGGVFAMGDKPTEALLKIIGNTTDPAGVNYSSDLGSIDSIYLTAYRPSYPTPSTVTGLKLVDVHSLNIDNIRTFKCLTGIEAVGSHFTVKQFHSVTEDTQALTVAGDSYTAAPVVDVNIWASYTDGPPVAIASTVTAGVVKLRGIFQSDISAVATKTGAYPVDSDSAGALDITGLTNDATGFDGLTNHAGELRDAVSISGTQTLTNKTFTDPKINNVHDTNGAVSLELGAISSATNWVRINNAAAGNGVGIQATGNDDNVGFDFVGKGSGSTTVWGTFKVAKNGSPWNTVLEIDPAAGTSKVDGNPIGVRVAVPASAGAAGTPGMWATDSSYLYVCTAASTWVRGAVSFATW